MRGLVYAMPSLDAIYSRGTYRSGIFQQIVQLCHRELFCHQKVVKQSYFAREIGGE